MAAFVSDTFTGSDTTVLSSHTGETGATWTNIATDAAFGTQVIKSNRIFSAGPGGSGYTASGTPPSADYKVEADFVWIDGAASAVAIIGRMFVWNPAINSFDGYALQHRTYYGWQLISFNFGGGSTLATIGAEMSSGTVHAKLEMIGTAIKAYLDGVEVASVSDSSFTATGLAGVVSTFGGWTSTTGIHLDNFSADAAGGGGGGGTVIPVFMNQYRQRR